MKIRRRYNRTGSRKNARKNPYRGAPSKQTVVVEGISPASFLIGSRNGRHYGGFAAVRRAFAGAITPDRECNKKQISDDESSDVGLAADAEAIAVQSFSKNKVDAVPRHQDREKTNHAGDDKTEFGPPTGETSVQGGDVTEKRDQGPGLLRVPTPEPSPGIIRPHSAKNGAGGKKEDAQLQQAIEPEMHRRICPRTARIARITEK